MRLPRLLRSTSFRLTLLYAGLTAASFLLLFAVIFWSMTQFMQHQIDIVVSSEIKELSNRADDDTLAGMQRAIQRATLESPSFFYLLQDRRGNRLAGNLPPLEPRLGEREWAGRARLAQYSKVDIRGHGVFVVEGGYFFVGLDAHQVPEMRESIARSFLWSFGAAMLLVLSGGAAMSVSVLRRLEAMSQASRDIVAGDLQRRIALNGSADEFDHLAISLNAMLERIQVLMDGMRQVSTDIAHDLRTPLTRLRQRIERSQEKLADTPALQTMLGATLADIDAILQTFGALLRISQVESGAGRANFAPVDLSELLQTIFEVYEPAFELKQQSLRQHVEKDLQIVGDRELLTQLFANLVENATRHCPPGSKVILHADRGEAGIRVSVSDDGPGIPSEMHVDVLKRFVRLDVSRSTPGNGLGLSLVAAVAALHQATLELADCAPGLRVSVLFAAPPLPPA